MSKQLDAHYKQEKDVLRRAINAVFQKNVTERTKLTLLECKNVEGKSILNIGSSLGPLASELSRKGAHITSIKLSTSKIELNARKLFLEPEFKQNFNLTLALGLFDYIEDPVLYLKKMRILTEEKCVMSFPSYATFQMPLRIIWMRSRKYPIYFYTKSTIKKLVAAAFSRCRIKNISAGYHCVAHP